MVSCTKQSVAGPLSPVIVRWGLHGLDCPAHPTDAQFDLDLETLEAKSTPQTHCVPQTIVELLFAVWQGTYREYSFC